MGVLGGLILKPTSQIPTAGLVAEYLASNNALDTSGNGYNGTPSNITYGNDRNSNPNSAFVLNGTSSYVNISGTIVSLQSTTKGTWSAWVKGSGAVVPGENILGFGNSSLSIRLTTFFANTGAYRIFAQEVGINNYDLITDDPIYSETWKHYAVVHNGTDAILYVDGVAVDQGYNAFINKAFWFSGATFDTGNIGAITYNSGGVTNFFRGSIDDVRIYDRDLSQAEIIILANE